jgi:DnaJ domain
VTLFYLLIGLGVLLLLYSALRGFVGADPRTLVTGLRWAAVIGGGAAAVFLLLTGRLNQAIFLVAALAPLFMRWKALWNTIRNATGPSRGQSSGVETAWLRMSLDHDTGGMDGTVLQGRWKGRRLSELSVDGLLDLLAETRVNDPDSAQLVEAYLDRARPDWRDAASEAGTAQPQPLSGAMTREEACRILEVEPNADEAAIRDAHRRLMMKLHPDMGGSSYLAAKINQAKDVLLGT